MLQANHPWLSKMASYFHARPLFCFCLPLVVVLLSFSCAPVLSILHAWACIYNKASRRRSRPVLCGRAGATTLHCQGAGASAACMFDTSGRKEYWPLLTKKKQQIIGVAGSGWMRDLPSPFLCREHPGICMQLFTLVDSCMHNWQAGRQYRIYVHVKEEHSSIWPW